MISKNYATTVLTLCVLVNASAVDNNWLGANSGGTSTDVEDTASWSGGTVPTTGETAVFDFTSSTTDLSFDATDTLFNPSGLSFIGNGTTTDLYVLKDLDLTDGLFVSGQGSGGSGNIRTSRLVFGATGAGVTINASNLSLGPSTPSWGFFLLGSGDQTADSSTVLNITGDWTLSAPNNSQDNSSINSTAGASLENPTNTLGPQLRFTGSGATISIASGGKNTTGSIGLGWTHLDVRSDQTWNFDSTAFISMLGSAGSPGFAGKYLVESIDGGRLDNLGGLNIFIAGNASHNADATTGMRLHGGTYGSLWMNSTGSSGRDQYINIVDHVSFVGGAVDFDVNGDPEVTPWGLILRNTAGNSDTQYLNANSFDVAITNGLKIVDDGPANNQSYNNDPLVLLVEGSTLTIGGDVLMTSSTARSPEAPAGGSGFLAASNLSIDGGATGVDFTLGGNWDVRVVGSNRDNLKNSIFTMVGDAATFEVADAAGTSGVGSSKWGLGTFNVGGVADPANVQLVNNFINDNPVTGDAELDKVGEMLIAGVMNINANSTLDVNGLNVELGGLSMDPTAVLDLNSGVVLVDSTIIESFVGLGDQLASWQSFEAQVIDSSNPLFEFIAVIDGGNTKWQAVLVPEPETYALFAGAVMGLIVFWRRRK